MRTEEEVKEYQRRWREANREKRAAYAKMYRQKHKERLKKQDAVNGKKYRARNKEAIKKRTEKWLKENPRKAAEYSRQWRERNPERAKEVSHNYLEKNRQRLSQKQSTFNKTPKGKYIRYKASAKKRGHTFNLKENEFTSILGSTCYYCGVGEKIGVDRVDSKKGYVIENCVPACSSCNYFKGVRKPQDFIAHAKRIAKHNA